MIDDVALLYAFLWRRAIHGEKVLIHQISDLGFMCYDDDVYSWLASDCCWSFTSDYVYKTKVLLVVFEKKQGAIEFKLRFSSK